MAKKKRVIEDTSITGVEADRLRTFYTLEFLLAHGFRKPMHERASQTVDTGSSKFTIMVGPSGYLLEISQHIKDHD